VVDSLKDRLKALDERIQYKMRNMNKLDKLYKEVSELQAQVDTLNNRISAANTEITVILNGIKNMENEINAIMQNVSTHRDFV